MGTTHDRPAALAVRLVRSPAAVAAAVALLGFAAVALTDGARTAAWWPAAGVAVAAAACTRGRRRALVLLAVSVGSFAGNAAGGRPPLLAAAFALANTAEAAVAGAVLGARGRPGLATVADLGRLLGAAVLGAGVVGGLVTAVLAAAPGTGPGVWPSVAASHATAVLLLVPLVMRVPDPPPSVTRLERAAVWTALLVSTAAVFGTGLFVPLTFVPAAVLVWAGLRLGVRAAAAQLVVVGVVVALCSAAGRGPFATLALLPQRPEPFVTEVLVQVFLACCASVVLALAVTAAQRETALAALAHQRRFDQAVLEAVDAGVLACDAAGAIVLRNRAHRRLTGVPDGPPGVGPDVDPDAVAARLDVSCDGEPVPPHRSPLRRALAGEVLAGLDLRVGRPDGPDHQLVAAARPIRDERGRTMGAVAAFTDVTAERTTQAHLRDSVAFHDAVLTASPDMIYVADVDDHRLAFASRPLPELVGGGADPATMGGPGLAAVLHPDDVPALLAADAAVAGLADGAIGKVRLRVAVGEGYRTLSRRVTPFARDAAGRVTQVLGVARDITDNVAFEDRLAEAALHDPLTGLPNRRLLVQRLDAALHHQADTGRDAGARVPVLFCDLDGFKQVNDGAGHAAGDAVLRIVAARLRSLLRPVDVAARVGGDEFVVVLGGGADRALAGTVAARIVDAVREPVVVDGAAHAVSVSVGVALAAAGDDPADALRAADRAMYDAKARRHRVHPDPGSARAGVR